MTGLIETHYLPSVAYFAALWGLAEIRLEKHEYFVKQSYRNRCHILSAQGKKNLIVPLTSKHGKVYITAVRIDYGQKWLNNHFRTLQSAYGKAPFFEHYCQDLERALFRKTTFLYDLNCELLSMCLKWLQWDVTITETTIYEKMPGSEVLDLRSAINVKKSDSLQEFYRPARYWQVFGNTFADNLSLIDLIFCEGPEAAQVVRESAIAK